MLNIRRMSRADLPFAMRLKEQAGWNQTESDLIRLLDLEPEGCFVAEYGSAPVGTTTTCIFGPVAWIAMVLVEPAARGRGIGTALMRHALEFLERRGVRTVRLDATPLGQPIYERLGFTAQFQLARFAGMPVVNDPAQLSNLASDIVAGLSLVQMEELTDLDRSITGTDRRRLLMRLFEQRPEAFLVCQSDGRVTGYLTSRPGVRAVQIGPCLARKTAGQPLLAAALRSFRGQAVFLDIPTGNEPATRTALRAGLSVQRYLLRMCHGEGVQERIEELWASSGPEKG